MRFDLRLLVGGLSVGLAVSIGCSGKDEPEPYANVSEFCAGQASAECSASVISACAAPDATKCKAQRQQTCVSEVPANSTYRQPEAKDCLMRVEAAYADARLTAAEIAAMRQACREVFDGRGDVGDACSKDSECKQSAGQRCVFRVAPPTTGSGPTGGTCRVPKMVNGGESCSAPEAMCVEGFHCGSTNHCIVNAEANEACTDVLPCKVGLKCTAGQCAPKLSDGSLCTGDDECVNNICLAGAGMGGSGLCVSQVILSPNEPFCIASR